MRHSRKSAGDGSEGWSRVPAEKVWRVMAPLGWGWVAHPTDRKVAPSPKKGHGSTSPQTHHKGRRRGEEMGLTDERQGGSREVKIFFNTPTFFSQKKFWSELVISVCGCFA